MNTRLAKLDAGEYDAIILAAAGLKRLGFEARIRGYLPEEVSIPAIGQGVLAVEHLAQREDLGRVLAMFRNGDTEAAARAERALGLVAEGSCEVPVGALARVHGEALRIEGFIGLPDGSRLVRDHATGLADNAASIGRMLGERLLEIGGRSILVNATRPLEGLGVVLTRPEGAAGDLARELAAMGARTFHFPSLSIRPIEDSPVLDAVLATLPDCDLAVFVSANAVEAGFAALRRRAIAWPRGLRAAAVGEMTAAALRNSGVADVISPSERFDSDALLALAELQAVQGRNIIVFRGEGGRERLREGLEARGAVVAYAECYRRERPESDPSALLAAWSRGEVQVVGVLSAETLENFVAMIGPEGRSRLAATVLVVTHEAIAGHPDAKRFGRVLVSRPGAASLADTLARVREPS